MGIFHGESRAIEKCKLVLNARRRHDNGLIELTLQPLLDNLQVKKPKKAATESLAKGYGGIFLIDQCGVIELVLFERIQKGWIIIGRYGVERRKDHRLYIFESRQWRLNGIGVQRYRVADSDIGHGLYPCNHIPTEPADSSLRDSLLKRKTPTSSTL